MSMVSMETKTEFDKSAIQTQQKLFSSINFSIIFKIKSANFPIVNYFRQYTIMVLEYLLYNSSTIHLLYTGGLGGSMSQVAGYTSLSQIRRGFAPGFVNYKKGCTRLAAASDKVYQLLAHGRWFSPASSTTETGRHDNS